jgi:hypothetical protein
MPTDLPPDMPSEFPTPQTREEFVRYYQWLRKDYEKKITRAEHRVENLRERVNREVVGEFSEIIQELPEGVPVYPRVIPVYPRAGYPEFKAIGGGTPSVGRHPLADLPFRVPVNPLVTGSRRVSPKSPYSFPLGSAEHPKSYLDRPPPQRVQYYRTDFPYKHGEFIPHRMLVPIPPTPENIAAYWTRSVRRRQAGIRGTSGSVSTRRIGDRTTEFKRAEQLALPGANLRSYSVYGTGVSVFSQPSRMGIRAVHTSGGVELTGEERKELKLLAEAGETLAPQELTVEERVKAPYSLADKRWTEKKAEEALTREIEYLSAKRSGSGAELGAFSKFKWTQGTFRPSIYQKRDQAFMSTELVSREGRVLGLRHKGLDWSPDWVNMMEDLGVKGFELFSPRGAGGGVSGVRWSKRGFTPQQIEEMKQVAVDKLVRMEEIDIRTGFARGRGAEPVVGELAELRRTYSAMEADQVFPRFFQKVYDFKVRRGSVLAYEPQITIQLMNSRRSKETMMEYDTTTGAVKRETLYKPSGNLRTGPLGSLRRNLRTFGYETFSRDWTEKELSSLGKEAGKGLSSVPIRIRGMHSERELIDFLKMGGEGGGTLRIAEAIESGVLGTSFSMIPLGQTEMSRGNVKPVYRTEGLGMNPVRHRPVSVPDVVERRQLTAMLSAGTAVVPGERPVTQSLTWESLFMSNVFEGERELKRTSTGRYVREESPEVRKAIELVKGMNPYERSTKVGLFFEGPEDLLRFAQQARSGADARATERQYAARASKVAGNLRGLLFPGEGTPGQKGYKAPGPLGMELPAQVQEAAEYLKGFVASPDPSQIGLQGGPLEKSLGTAAQHMGETFWSTPKGEKHARTMAKTMLMASGLEQVDRETGSFYPPQEVPVEASYTKARGAASFEKFSQMEGEMLGDRAAGVRDIDPRAYESRPIHREPSFLGGIGQIETIEEAEQFLKDRSKTGTARSNVYKIQYAKRVLRAEVEAIGSDLIPPGERPEVVIKTRGERIGSRKVGEIRQRVPLPPTPAERVPGGFMVPVPEGMTEAGFISDIGYAMQRGPANFAVIGNRESAFPKGGWLDPEGPGGSVYMRRNQAFHNPLSVPSQPRGVNIPSATVQPVTRQGGISGGQREFVFSRGLNLSNTQGPSAANQAVIDQAERNTHIPPQARRSKRKWTRNSPAQARKRRAAAAATPEATWTGAAKGLVDDALGALRYVWGEGKGWTMPRVAVAGLGALALSSAISSMAGGPRQHIPSTSSGAPLPPPALVNPSMPPVPPPTPRPVLEHPNSRRISERVILSDVGTGVSDFDIGGLFSGSGYQQLNIQDGRRSMNSGSLSWEQAQLMSNFIYNPDA